MWNYSTKLHSCIKWVCTANILKTYMSCPCLSKSNFSFILIFTRYGATFSKYVAILSFSWSTSNCSFKTWICNFLTKWKHSLQDTQRTSFTLAGTPDHHFQFLNLGKWFPLWILPAAHKIINQIHCHSSKMPSFKWKHQQHEQLHTQTHPNMYLAFFIGCLAFAACWAFATVFAIALTSSAMQNARRHVKKPEFGTSCDLSWFLNAHMADPIFVTLQLHSPVAKLQSHIYTHTHTPQAHPKKTSTSFSPKHLWTLLSFTPVPSRCLPRQWTITCKQTSWFHVHGRVQKTHAHLPLNPTACTVSSIWNFLKTIRKAAHMF